jgi:hypothetical protein
MKKNELRRYINNRVQEKSELSPKSLAFILFSKRMFSFHSRPYLCSKKGLIAID